MTTELANFFYDLNRSVLVALLDEYTKRRPAVHTVKSVAAYLGHRQHYRAKHGATCTDESLDQIARAVALGVDAVANALQFLTWAGYLETLKHGGGQGKKPTVRLVHDSTSTERAIARRVGNELNALQPELNALLRGTPRGLPRVNQDTHKTLRQLRASTLISVSEEYTKKELQGALARGERIGNPGAWKATVRKTVSHPTGEHYETANDLIAGNPELQPAEIADLLIKANQEALQVPTAEKFSPELNTALSAVMGIRNGRGMAAAIEYCKEQPAHLQPDLVRLAELSAPGEPPTPPTPESAGLMPAAVQEQLAKIRLATGHERNYQTPGTVTHPNATSNGDGLMAEIERLGYAHQTTTTQKAATQ